MKEGLRPGLAFTSQDRFDEIRTGHVKELIKKYEYWSSTTPEGLTGKPRNGETTHQGNFEPRSR